MTLAQLRTVERCYWKLMRVLEKALPKGHERRESVTKAWNAAYQEFQVAARAAAARRDKGEVLWTLCMPHKHYVREITRTALRCMSTYHYDIRDSAYRCVRVRPVNSEGADVRNGRLYEPWSDLEQEWRDARRSCATAV